MTNVVGNLSERDLIENLMGEYTLGYDEDDFGRMADCFTSGAEMTIRIAEGDLIGPFTGRDAIVGMMKETHASQTDRRRHVISNVVINLHDGTSATASSYLTLMSIEGGNLTVLATGRYDDELVKNGAGWRFTKRHIQLDLPY